MDIEFKIKMGEFEGPLEVLLDMVEKRKLHINDISLSEVADTFIEHVNSHKEFPMGDSADFILIASTLLLIKSKSLLPNLELTEEERENIHDLEKRLELYKKYKAVSFLIREIFGRNPLYFSQENNQKNKLKPVIFSPTLEINTESIFENIKNVLKNMPKTELLPKVMVNKVISLEEMIENLYKRVEKSLKMSFREFANKENGEKYDKVTIIVSFLAMLELVKQGIVRVSQETHFEDISIESENLTVPRY